MQSHPLSLDGLRWVACRPGFFLPVRVLSRLFRRLFLEKLLAAFDAGQLQFVGGHADLSARDAFTAFLAPLRKAEWVVYSKRPFGGPEAVLAYLARYTHRVAISNSRLIALRDGSVMFKWKDYRLEGRDRQNTMTLPVAEFIRRFLVHVLPSGFHRIRHYGLLASGFRRKDNIARVRQLLTPAMLSEPNQTADDPGEADPLNPWHPCPCCGGRMNVVDTFGRYQTLSAPRFAQPDQDRHFMINIPSPVAPPAAVCSSAGPDRQRAGALFNRATGSSSRRQTQVKTSPPCDDTPAFPLRNPTDARSILAATLRRRPPAILKSP